MRFQRLTITVLTAGVLAAGLTGCACGRTTPTAIATPAHKPMIVSISTLRNRDIDLPRSTVLVLDTDGEPFTGWSATFSSAGVATFHDGSVKGSMTLNPGITPTADGVTEVTLKRGIDSGLRFRLQVTG